MKARYDRKADILLIEGSDEKIDYAEEMGPIIVHFTRDRRPVLLEILDASDFISSISKIGMRSKREEPMEIPF